MKINSFKATDVHGYLRFDISFFSDLTFLIGINGAGKTSALKLILGLTTPSYNYLNQIEYDWCEVMCSSHENENNIVIEARQFKEQGTFEISLTWNGATYSSGQIQRFVKKSEGPFDSDDYSVLEQQKRELFDALTVARKIRELATPKFLGLDRRIYEGTVFDHRRVRRYPTKLKGLSSASYLDTPAIDISIEEVQSLVYDYIRKLPEKQYFISDDFKQQIFSNSFTFIDANDVEDIPSLPDLTERKTKVIDAIEKLGVKYIGYSITEFFKKMEGVVKEHESLKDRVESDQKLQARWYEVLGTWYNNGAQLKRIDDIIERSEEYQRRIAQLRSPLVRLQTITSHFLKEGNKVLNIRPDGEIHVTLKNDRRASLYELSSGEKQIVIMIAHLIFEEDQKASGIFIIDEPELSLHIAWQEIFVRSIMQASPKTQFILATHSPAILGEVEMEKYCQDLNKHNF